MAVCPPRDGPDIYRLIFVSRGSFMAFDQHRSFLSSVAKTVLAAFVTMAGIGMTHPDVVFAKLDPATSTAILAALADERKAEAYYQAVIDRFGEVKPFSNIAGAERRHAESLEKLCRKYGIDIPIASTGEVADVPDTIKEACAAAVEAEERNIGLYDDLLPKLSEHDVSQTFEHLQAASKNHHLPAFTRCAEGGAHGEGHGGGHGAGQGGGRGADGKSAAGSCGQCGQGAACGCSQASESEKKARAAAGGGCGCAKRAAQQGH
jgi:rubrerythrin